MDPNTPPVTQPGFGRAQGLMAQSGRARGLRLPAAEATVGVARGAIFTSLEPQQRPGPSYDPMTQHVRLLQRNWHKSDICSNFIPRRISHIMKGNAFGCLQGQMPAHGQTSALVSMFRGIGIDYSMTPRGRGMLPVGQY